MVKEYCSERKNKVDPEQFVDAYASKGWMIGKNRMKDWQAAIRLWEKNNNINFKTDGKDRHSNGRDIKRVNALWNK
ncbi:MAG: hypothetical protein U5L72_10405 [Bacteroidales bacterium]|nr:hypothetical protein [Bacteroidales bacterium]